MNEELTEHLFDKVHDIALDLGAFNIQRGRDHGLPSYGEYRRWCGLDNRQTMESWNDLTQDIKQPEIRAKLQRLYGHPENIDVWVGGLLETPVPDGRVGPLVQCLLVDQFKRLRDGDRFWYENPSTFKPAQLDQIRETSLAAVMCDNSDDIRHVPLNSFKQISSGNPLVDCQDVPRLFLGFWSGRNSSLSYQLLLLLSN